MTYRNRGQQPSFRTSHPSLASQGSNKNKLGLGLGHKLHLGVRLRVWKLRCTTMALQVITTWLVVTDQRRWTLLEAQ